MIYRIILSFALSLTLILPLKASDFKEIDNKAKNVPWAQAISKSKLVDYLTSNLKKDIEKVRAIAVFITYQMDHNLYEENKIQKLTKKNKMYDFSDDTIPFTTRIGNSQDYAELFQELCQLAGLNVALISGYAGNDVPKTPYITSIKMEERQISKFENKKALPLQPYISFWNAVMLDGKWYLIDTYWMDKSKKGFGKDIRTDSAFNSSLKKRLKKLPTISNLTKGKSIDEKFFMADPKTFLETHFPDEEKWQLRTFPISWHEFTR